MSFRTRTSIRKFFGDYGNWPLIAANAGAVAFVVLFGGRKLLHHPDVNLDRKERDMGAVVTPTRIENANDFRTGTGYTAQIFNFLQRIGAAATGRQSIDISNYGKERVPAPLEHTSYFDDGLYAAVPATPAPTGEFTARDYDEDDLENLQ